MKYTIKDGIVYDARQLLADVAEMSAGAEGGAGDWRRMPPAPGLALPGSGPEVSPGPPSGCRSRGGGGFSPARRLGLPPRPRNFGLAPPPGPFHPRPCAAGRPGGPHHHDRPGPEGRRAGVHRGPASWRKTCVLRARLHHRGGVRPGGPTDLRLTRHPALYPVARGGRRRAQAGGGGGGAPPEPPHDPGSDDPNRHGAEIYFNEGEASSAPGGRGSFAQAMEENGIAVGADGPAGGLPGLPHRSTIIVEAGIPSPIPWSGGCWWRSRLPPEAGAHLRGGHGPVFWGGEGGGSGGLGGLRGGRMRPRKMPAFGPPRKGREANLSRISGTIRSSKAMGGAKVRILPGYRELFASGVLGEGREFGS